jgi:hypothetical protein
LRQITRQKTAAHPASRDRLTAGDRLRRDFGSKEEGSR